MAFTGVAVVKRVSDSLVRITGVSLAAGANGTIGLFGDVGAGIQLPDDFDPTPYEDVTVVDALEVTVSEDAASVPAGGAPAIKMFYGLTAGTGSAGNDYAATVAVGAAVPFPRVGPATAAAAGIVAGGVNQFVLPTTGIYRVSWAIDFLEASQLELAIGGVAIDNTCQTSGAGTQENVKTVLINAVAGNLLSLINPAGNAAALTVQTADGNLTHAQAPSLVIELVSPGAAGSGAADLSIIKTATPFRAQILNNDAGAATADLEIYVRWHN